MSAFRIRTVATAGGLTALLAAGGLAVMLNGSGSPAPGSPGEMIATVAFTDFTDCGTLLDYYRKHGHDIVGPYGLPGSEPMYALNATAATGVVPRAALGAPSDAAGSGAAAPAATGTSTQSDTGTNVQVAGVDEADVAKLSGSLLLTVAGPPNQLVRPMAPTPGTAAIPGAATTSRTGLRILSASGTRATPVGMLPTSDWAPTQLLVQGSTVLLFGTVTQPITSGPGATPSAPIYRQRTRIAQVDIADPAHPRQLRTLDLDGTLVGARLSGTVVRIAVSSAPTGVHLVTPQSSVDVPPALNPAGPGSAPGGSGPGSAPGGSASGGSAPGGSSGDSSSPSPAPTTEQQSLAANRKIIADSQLEDWLPQYTLSEGGTRDVKSGSLLPCTKVASPADFSGLDTLSLLSFDLGAPRGIFDWDGAGVVASGTTLYATADRSYVATTPWQDWKALSGDRLVQAEQRQRTWIHAFTTDGASAPRYLASGSVPGFLLNQYALDEYHGDLRVASTVQPTGLAGDLPEQPVTPPQASGSASKASGSATATSRAMPTRAQVESSQVTVLRPVGNRLAQVGAVGGMGHGEQIRAVRFIGPVGYVVTFRQTDPLYTVDLSDPTKPRIAGELKLLGYSAYLHPAGDGRLLGVGRSAGGDGRTTGLQLSLFDVSNPAAPRRLAQQTLSGAFSDTENDAHAFTFSDGLVLIPYSRTLPVVVPRPTYAPGQSPQAGTDSFVPDYVTDGGIVAVRVSDNALAAPQLLHPTGTAVTPRSYPNGSVFDTGAPLRTFIADGAIWTVTSGGVAAHQESSLRWLSYTRFTR
jgi:Beta propeller domain